ncbi:flagellin [Caloramator proteoclasticus]|uniref:Flagellin n=1 Tax=Caloramator proteoclasticus DSM 10124 TaxID=1121262 RepID=A0A1M5B4B1_9CLOT|nr:flagellin [Caloramator proteoclasticus]SHF37299.1 flagellin [Caloramator proteoclasticus DSM 10124]
MIINHNLNAMNAHRQLGINTVNAGKSMEKLSSGLRINRAGDDAAGLAISEKMRGQIRGLDQAARNAQDGISLIQTAEGALNETHSILQRMRELAVQASNDTNVTVDRDAIQTEMNQLAREVNRIADTTQFNTQDLLKGSFSANLQIGANENQYLNIDIKDMRATGAVLNIATNAVTDASVKEVAVVNKNNDVITGSTDITVSNTISRDMDIKVKVLTAPDGLSDNGLFEVTVNGVTKKFAADSNDTDSKLTIDGSQFGDLFGSGESIVINAQDDWTADDEYNIKIEGKKDDITGPNVSTYNDAKAAITRIDNAINKVSEERSKLGAYQNRLEHTINNLGTSSENLTAAESRVRDVDMAKEMMTFSKNNILAQAAQAMLAQANQQPQGVLQLLR